MSEAWPNILTTPEDAAIRQASCGFRLLLLDEDPLAIHNLAYASYTLLRDLAKKQSNSVVLSLLNKDSKKFKDNDFWRLFSDLGNSLKHADRQAGKTTEEFNEILLFINCMLARELGILSTVELCTLWMWMHCCYFITIDDAPSAMWDWAENNISALYDTERKPKIEAANKLYTTLCEVNLDGYTMQPENDLIPWRLILQPNRGFYV
ncbi:MAG TPA: hypothetical protein ENJ28_05485 [Gammaproteobacteria bacterium]|nr:hypothetical protein [Gammaproteobacteria bacterium]